MATTLKALGRGSLGTSSSTLYTVPSATTSIITNIVICNTNSSAETFNLSVAGSEIFYTAAIQANQTLTVDMKQAISATQTITGLASNTGIKYHISGAEIA
jgi:hypothetical protein